ncbi:MAG: aminoacyl-tRNA hydrolase [bacterium]|nr:aminoacyl-tRNA hydrolase [bacterium]
MKLVVGLGNPEVKYHLNRHNFGFLLIDQLAKSTAGVFSPWKGKEKFLGWLSSGRVEGGQVLLLKPSTYMNYSGGSVARVKSTYLLSPEQIAVVHDDLDLPFGKVAWQFDRSAAGHHGVESIMEALDGRKDFYRLRLGIGKPPPGQTGEDYVLEDFSSQELKELPNLINQAVESLLPWLLV